MTFKCCVRGCRYEGKNGFHSFPANEEISKKWIELSKIKFPERLITRSKNKTLSHSFYKICKRHFQKNAYETNDNGERRLKKGVTPTLYLPDTLLQIKKDHDYAMSPKMQVLPGQQRNSMITDSNHTVLKANFFDFNNSDGIGANAELVLNDISNVSYEIPNGIHNDAETAAELNYYKKRSEELEQKLKECEWNDDNVVKYLGNKCNNKQQLEFFKMQIYNFGKQINARRYNSDQKSLTLAMYKQSPKKYRFLKKIFILPAKSTLGRHSANLMFQAGIDSKLLGIIKQKVNDLSDSDKYCVITWDEVALHAHLDYNTKRDMVDGFVDMNGVRHPEFATHSLTFMVRGINRPYKEPVGFFYTAGINYIELAGLVKLTIAAVFDTGLKPIGSVCDQPNVCTAAVHYLVNPKWHQKTSDGSLLEYKVCGNSIIHMFDLPHVMKVVRNNFLRKDLLHSVDKRWDILNCKNISLAEPKRASWEHISELYKLDCRSSYRLVPKLTDEHLNPSKDKMKVSNATQVFSKTVGSSEGESLKESVTDQSVHFAFWEYALSALANMNFVDKNTNNINNRSTVLKKFESTIRGYMEISRKCLNLNMSEIDLRNTNQDGLENFFGCCKELCGAKPIAPHYRSAYTTMIVNNLTGQNSLGSNCEEDTFEALLSNISEIILDYQEQPKQTDVDIMNNDNEIDVLDTIIFDPLFGEEEMNFIETESISDTSSVVCQKLIKLTNCSDCKSSLQEPSTKLEKCGMDITLPSQAFKSHFESIFCSLNNSIPHFCFENCVKKNLLSHIENIQLSSIGCEEHCNEITMKFKELTTTYALKGFCNDINNILSGKISTLPPNPSIMQQKALAFRQKRKRIGKYSDIVRE